MKITRRPISKQGAITLAEAITWIACQRSVRGDRLTRLRRYNHGKLPAAISAELDRGADQLVKRLLEGKITAIGRYQEGNGPLAQPSPIPETFLLAGVWCNVERNSIHIDWMSDGNFGEDRKYRDVLLKASEFFRAFPDGRISTSSRVSKQDLREWYKQRRPTWPDDAHWPPSLAKDMEDAKQHFGEDRVVRSQVIEIRKEFIPQGLIRRGRPPKKPTTARTH